MSMISLRAFMIGAPHDPADVDVVVIDGPGSDVGMVMHWQEHLGRGFGRLPR